MKKLSNGESLILRQNGRFTVDEKNRIRWPENSNGGCAIGHAECASGRSVLYLFTGLATGEEYFYVIEFQPSNADGFARENEINRANFPGLDQVAVGEWFNCRLVASVSEKIPASSFYDWTRAN